MGIDRFDDDSALLARVRQNGDAEAFAALYQRHHPSARRFARSLCRNETDADDLTAQVFTNLFVTLLGGRGPTDLALPYLIASIKHAHYRIARRRATEDAALVPGELAAGHDPADCVEIEVLRSAFATLPADARSLLWRSEVEDQTVQDLAATGGVSPHALAVQTHRARRALGTAYLAQHAEPEGGTADVEPECRLALSDLAALVRGRLGVRRRRQLERHLSRCAHCGTAQRRLMAVNARLRMHPRLPWEFATAGIGAAVRAQLSTFVAASTVTLAGAGALAVVNPSSPFAHEAVAASDPAMVLDHESTTTSSNPTDPVGPELREDARPQGFVGSEPTDVDPAPPLAVGSIDAAFTGSLTTPIVEAATSAPQLPASGAVAVPPEPGPATATDRPAEIAPHGRAAASSDDNTPASSDDAIAVHETQHRQTKDDDANGNGNGNDNGKAEGNPNANGNGNGQVNGNGNGQSDGDGQANGNGNGNGNGKAEGNGNGRADGDANGNGKNGHADRDTDGGASAGALAQGSSADALDEAAP